MSLVLKDVEFSTGIGAVGTTISITGAAAPAGGWKAVLLFTIGRTESTDAGAAGGQKRMIGWAAQTTEGGGLKQNSVASAHEHGVDSDTASGVHSFHNNAALTAISNTSPNEAGRAHVTAFTADGADLLVDVQFTINQRVLALFIGGGDITNIEIGAFSTPTSGTTPFTTDVSTGFTCQDDEAALFLMGSLVNTDNDSASDGNMSFGVATSPSKQWAWAGVAAEDNPSTTLTLRHLTADLCYQTWNGAATSLVRRAAFDSWIASGFRLSWKFIAGSASRVYWMAIKGGKWAAKTGLTATSLTTVPVTGAGFQPVGGLVVSHNGALQPSGLQNYLNTDQCSFGVFTGPASRRAVAQYDKHGVATASVGTRIEHDEVYIQTDEAGAVVGLMDVQSLDGDGVTFVMDDADPTAAAFGVLLAGSSGGAGGSGAFYHLLRRRR